MSANQFLIGMAIGAPHALACSANPRFRGEPRYSPSACSCGHLERERIKDLESKLAAAESENKSLRRTALTKQHIDQCAITQSPGNDTCTCVEDARELGTKLLAAEAANEALGRKVEAAHARLRAAVVASDSRDLTTEQAFRVLADAMPDVFVALHPEERTAMERAGIEPKSPRVG